MQAEAVAGALRELEAAKCRVERDARAVADAMRKTLVSELLPVLDNLDRTLGAARASGDAPAVVDGIVMVRAQLEGVLRGYGVERLDCVAQPFDPASHDAVTTIPVRTPDAHNLVMEQLAPAYRFGTTLLRPARVVVGRY